MSNVISFPIRTYVDFETLPTTKDTQQKPNHDGTLVKVSVNPAVVLTDNGKTELLNFVRRFRQWKWRGSKHVVVPVARAPVDPAHITYNANQPSIDPFDLMLFHAYKRWKNQFQTIPPPTQNFAERYFLMDPSWRKSSLLRPFSMFTRPYVSNIAQMMQTSHFTINPVGSGSGGYSDFDPSGLRAVSSEETLTGQGVPHAVTVVDTQKGYSTGAAPLIFGSRLTNINGHRHFMTQRNDPYCSYPNGEITGELRTAQSITDRLKGLVTGENDVNARFRFKSRADARADWVNDPNPDNYGADQANLTGYVNYGDAPRPEGSTSQFVNHETDTTHQHEVELGAEALRWTAENHAHYLSDEAVDEIQTRHNHLLSVSGIASNLGFEYTPPNIPPQSLPWWSTSSDSYVYGRRRARGWMDTRQASFVTGQMTDKVYSPTWPAFLWRIPCHYHTKYAFRMWITHWFALRSPILHELYVPTTAAVDGMMEEEGILDVSIRTPSAVAGIEGFTPETNEWIQSILANADAELAVPAPAGDE